MFAQKLYIGCFWPLIMTHHLWIISSVSAAERNSLSFRLNLINFDHSRAALWFDETSAALVQTSATLAPTSVTLILAISDRTSATFDCTLWVTRPRSPVLDVIEILSDLSNDSDIEFEPVCKPFVSLMTHRCIFPILTFYIRIGFEDSNCSNVWRQSAARSAKACSVQRGAWSTAHSKSIFSNDSAIFRVVTAPM